METKTIGIAKRARIRRAYPLRACWSVLVHFTPDMEHTLKSIAAKNRVGASAYIEGLVTERLKDLQHDAVRQ